MILSDLNCTGMCARTINYRLLYFYDQPREPVHTEAFKCKTHKDKT